MPVKSLKSTQYPPSHMYKFTLVYITMSAFWGPEPHRKKKKKYVFDI